MNRAWRYGKVEPTLRAEPSPTEFSFSHETLAEREFQHLKLLALKAACHTKYRLQLSRMTESNVTVLEITLPEHSRQPCRQVVCSMARQSQRCCRFDGTKPRLSSISAASTRVIRTVDGEL